MLPRLLAVLATALMSAHVASAHVKCSEGLPPVDRAAESRVTAQDFIRKVAAKEVAFARALGGYRYTVDASVQTLAGDAVDGEYRQVAIVGFDANGPRREIAEGRLIPILEDFNPGDVELIHAVFVGGASTPARVRAFVDFLVARLR